MTLSPTSTHEWRISTRSRGEVLAAAARSEGCQFLVLGVPGNQTIQEIEGWLGDLLGVAAESTRNDPGPRPIPTLLHHALTALLFSHREVWNTGPPASTFSLAFVQTGEEAAFGWVGVGQPLVWVDDQPAQDWVRVRDHEGKEAVALAVKAGARVRVSLDWAPPPPPGSAGIQVEAMWGAGDLPPFKDLTAEPDAAPFTPAEMAEPWPEASAIAKAVHSEVVPAAPRALAIPEEPDELPAAARETGEYAEPVPVFEPGPALPDLIPPSPEPADLTERALRSQTTSLEPVADAAAEPAAVPAPRPKPRIRPAWPSEQELRRARRRGVRPWLWILGLVVLAGAASAAWYAKRSAADDQGLAFFGLGTPRFQVSVDSRPEGAWIAADGKDLTLRTPASLALTAGEHQIALTFPDLGSASFTVRGLRGDHQTLSAPLWGSLTVHDEDATVPIAVDLDGSRIGTAPVNVDSLAPGAHEVGFSGPGLTPWGQTLRVRVGEVTEVIAKPMTTPANGVLEVRATYTDGNGTGPLEGASVWVDGDRRGATPLVLELPRGPHSVRVEYKGERAPVDVIDLPGGNQRFATFEMGVNAEAPSLEIGPLPAAIPLSRPTVVAGNLDGVTPTQVREMWLNVREPDGPWRRYQMVMIKSPGGVVGVALFPVALFDSHGSARYYISATSQTGDDYFTEILTAHSAPKQAPAN